MSNKHYMLCNIYNYGISYDVLFINNIYKQKHKRESKNINTTFTFFL